MSQPPRPQDRRPDPGDRRRDARASDQGPAPRLRHHHRRPRHRRHASRPRSSTPSSAPRSERDQHRRGAGVGQGPASAPRSPSSSACGIVPTLTFVPDALPESARAARRGAGPRPGSTTRRSRPAAVAAYAGEADPYKKPREEVDDARRRRRRGRRLDDEDDRRRDRARAPGWSSSTSPAGMTSHDVVARVRRLAGTRKVGHAGTLDPMATGVLVLGVDRATRLLGHLMLTEKAYDATIRLGRHHHDRRRRGRGHRGHRVGAPGSTEATVRDGAGRVRRRHRAGPDRGLGDQGRRQAGLPAGARRRAGRAAGAAGDDPRARGPRPRGRRATVLDVDISVRCSSGTYIRAIARDVGAALGVGGHLTALRRTAVGPFDLAVARTLDELADDFAVLPIAEAARADLPVRRPRRGAGRRRARRARRSTSTLRRRCTARSSPRTGEFLALYEPRGERARAVAVFV